MDEKPSAFTVTDRRKFTPEGELRNEERSEPSHEASAAAASQPEQPPEQAEPQEPRSEAKAGPRLVTMPAPEPVVDTGSPLISGRPEAMAPSAIAEEDLDEAEIPQFSAQESEAQQEAYKESSRQLDDMLRQANPGIGQSAEVTFDQVVQSIYLSAVVAMGAATEPGQKPRIDIVGARQSIDMLAILQDKTKGNLTEKERVLLQNALFELRMMFLEITNAIAQQAHRTPAGK